MAGLIVCQWVAFGWHPRILGRSWREGMASRLQTDIHTSTHTVIQTDIHTYMVTHVHSYRHTYMQTVGPETSFKPGLGAMEIACNAMEIAAKQTLCEEASLEAGLETGLSVIYLGQCFEISNELPLQVRCSIVVSISTCHAEDPGSIPGGGVCTALLLLALLPPIGAQPLLHIF